MDTSISSDKPLISVHEEVLGPIEDLTEQEEGQEEEVDESTYVDQEMVLSAISKIRHFMEDKLKTVAQTLQDRISELTQALEDSRREVKALRDSHLKDLRRELLEVSSSHAKATETWLNKRLEGLSGLQGDRLESLHKMFELGVSTAEERFKSLLSALPVPQIHFSVPEGAIKMEQLPARVTVNVPQQAAPLIENKFLVPESAFKFYVEQPAPQVILPNEAIKVIIPDVNVPPAQVTVNVPDQTPLVNVEAPKPHSVEKTFTYMEDGRPLKIIERPILDEE